MSDLHRQLSLDLQSKLSHQQDINPSCLSVTSQKIISNSDEQNSTNQNSSASKNVSDYSKSKQSQMLQKLLNCGSQKIKLLTKRLQKNLQYKKLMQQKLICSIKVSQNQINIKKFQNDKIEEIIAEIESKVEEGRKNIINLNNKLDIKKMNEFTITGIRPKRQSFNVKSSKLKLKSENSKSLHKNHTHTILNSPKNRIIKQKINYTNQYTQYTEDSMLSKNKKKLFVRSTTQLEGLKTKKFKVMDYTQYKQKTQI